MQYNVRMTRQKLMDELVNRYEDNAIAGKSAKEAGVSYSLKTKCFNIEYGDHVFELPAKFLADHPQGGDELEQHIKAWIKNG